jgi:ribosomal protein S18 acetylase RimI-like enzyme
VEAICQDDTAQVWVAELDGRPVGYLAVRIDSDARTGEIDMLAVDPLVQRRGIGRALTSLAVQRLGDAGMGSRLSAPAVILGMRPRDGSMRRQTSLICPGQVLREA